MDEKTENKLTIARPAIKLNNYHIFSRAVEEGIAYGYQRAFKYTDKPDAEGIKSSIEREVMNALCEIIQDFGDTYE